MATCDSYYRFTLVDIGAYGYNHDSTIFQESLFGRALLNEGLDLPNNANLPGTIINMNHFVVADQAFPLHERIMRPYPGHHLGEQKHIFNYRISRARRTIENTFGILVQRWRILKAPIIASVEMCEKFVKASVVLHNFLQKSEMEIALEDRRYCPTGFTDILNEHGVLQLGTWRDGKGIGDGLLPLPHIK